MLLSFEKELWTYLDAVLSPSRKVRVDRVRLANGAERLGLFCDADRLILPGDERHVPFRFIRVVCSQDDWTRITADYPPCVCFVEGNERYIAAGPLALANRQYAGSRVRLSAKGIECDEPVELAREAELHISVI
jgi:hypothetical protein